MIHHLDILELPAFQAASVLDIEILPAAVLHRVIDWALARIWQGRP